MPLVQTATVVGEKPVINRETIKDALNRCVHLSMTAQQLGISDRWLRKQIKKYKLRKTWI